MTISDEAVRRQLRLGEDSRWEFKEIRFNGDAPVSPRRNDLADELGAFANADGGVLLCGVSDDGRLQGMSRAQMEALDRLLVEISTDSIAPSLRIQVHRRELDETAFVLVDVPKGNAVHERDGRAFIRVGSTRRRLDSGERLRLAQNRARSRHLWFDRQVVPQTGFETLSQRLWEPLLSVSAAADPRRGLLNLRLLAPDEAGVVRTTAGILPEYRVGDDSSIVLSIPAATLDLAPAAATVTVRSEGTPLAGVEVLALFPNGAGQRGVTDETGEAVFDLYTASLPMTVFAAAPGHAAGLKREWRPHDGDLQLELGPLPSGGAAILSETAGHLPGLRGRLNPIRDTADRACLYADGIAIDEGREQPVPVRLGRALRLTDAHGAELSVTIVDLVGRAALVEFRPFGP